MIDATTTTPVGIGASGETRSRLQQTRETRRGGNRIRRLHHHAVRTNDMEATRRFYEDLLGMPMVAAMRESLDLGAGETPFLHCFFEMADGSCLAFFQFPPEAFGPASALPRHGVDHHLAMAVPDFDEIARLKAKFDEMRYPNCGINHGFCYSLYVRDPNGMLVEFVCEPENELEINEAVAVAAHDELAKWQRGDQAPAHVGRVTVTYPLPTSPQQDILTVVGGEAGPRGSKSG
jgi:glyoxylase I family protein